MASVVIFSDGSLFWTDATGKLLTSGTIPRALACAGTSVGSQAMGLAGPGLHRYALTVLATAISSQAAFLGGLKFRSLTGLASALTSQVAGLSGVRSRALTTTATATTRQAAVVARSGAAATIQPSPAQTSVPGYGQSATQVVGLTQPALFVSPTGSDGNPGTQLSPKLTFAAAQTAMRSQGIKTLYFRGGIYTGNPTLTISETDNGTSWLGYPGEVPIIDGGGTVVAPILLQYYPTGVLVDHLTIRNCITAGIFIHGGGGGGAVKNTISNCEVYNVSMTNIAGGAGNSGGILMTFNTQNNLITHNYVHDTACAGISMAAGSSGESINGNTVTFNRVMRTNNTGQLDTGGIYVLDRTGAQSGGTIANNFVQDTSKNPSGGGPGASGDNTKGIYLDDMASGFTVAYNIVCGNEAMAVQYHGGTNNRFSNNVFDVSQTTLAVLYQDDSQFGGTTMAGNTCTGNIFYSSRVYAGNVGEVGQPGLFTVGFIAGLTKPQTVNNIYWNTANTAVPFPNSGAIDVIDPSPRIVNPLFRNAAGHDYSFTDGGAAAQAANNFFPIDQTVIGPNTQIIGTATATVSGVPTASTIGADISGSVVLRYIQTAYAVLATGGADEGTRTPFGGTALPRLQAQTSASYTYRVYDSAAGGSILAESPAIIVGGAVATATLSNVTTSLSVGGSVSGTVSLRYIVTAWATLATGGADTGARVSFTGSLLPSLVPATIGTYTVRLYSAATAGSLLAESGPINVHAVGALASPAFFIATNGSDANAGTQALPFLTFEAALAAMQTSGTKTTYVRAGTYARTAKIAFNDSSSTAIGGPGPKTHDNGVTIIRFPGESPIIDGGGTVTDLFFLDYHSAGITIDGIEIRNCLNSGVHLNGYRTPSDEGTVSGCIIQNCYIHNIANGVSNPGAGNTGGVRGSFATQNNIVRNNRITDTFGPSVSFVSGSANETIAGNQILNNICMRANNTNQADTGSIYLLDRGHGAISTATVTIAGNFVQDPGNGAATKGIYLDDHASRINVTGNIVCGTMKNGMQLHGGDHVVFSGNIFDLSSCSEQPLYYQEAANSAPGNWGMGFNYFNGNILYHNGTPSTADVWLFETDGVSPMALPTVSANVYFAALGAFPNTGVVIDSSPHVVNPLFRNPNARDYSFTDGGAAVMAAIGFTPINQAAIGPAAP